MHKAIAAAVKQAAASGVEVTAKEKIKAKPMKRKDAGRSMTKR